MMAAHRLRQRGGLLLALVLLLLGVLSACERQLQDAGVDLLPGNDTEELDESETGIVDAPTADAVGAEEPAEPVETEPVDEDQPVSGIPADDPVPLPGAEAAATEESPRPGDNEAGDAEDAAPEATEEGTEAAGEDADAEAAPETEETGEEAAADETAMDQTADEEAADEEAADEAAADEAAADEAAADEAAADEAAADEAAADEAAADEAAADEEAADEEAAEEEAAEETAATEQTEAAAPTTAEERVHVVQAGENLYRIGLQYGISWLALANHNNLPNANAIFVGQELRIPGESDGSAPTPTPTPAETTYVVQAGDTLHRIGQRFNVSWMVIAEANGLVNPNHILVGQELKIPTAGATPAPQLTHTVQPRETLFLISLHYGVPWMSIASANNLSAPYLIYAGQTLVIPSSTQ